MKFSPKKIELAVKSKGYVWFETGDYNLNIVGIRNSNIQNKVTNKFDDLVTLTYKVNGITKYHEFDATTDPGRYWEKNLLNPNGVAILVPNQYRGSHTIGLHQGKYEALRQHKPVKVYRDRNKDGKFDMLEESIQEGIFGINIHRANSAEWSKSTQIDKWSAGCQVIAANQDFKKFMDLVNKSANLYGKTFTYTLIESKDIV